MPTTSADDPVRRYMELAREYHRFEAHYFGVSWSEGKLQPAEKRLDAAAVQTLEQMRADLDAAREAWIQSLLAS